MVWIVLIRDGSSLFHMAPAEARGARMALFTSATATGVAGTVEAVFVAG